MEYKIRKKDELNIIDANWDKDFWADVDYVELNKVMGEQPKYFPVTKARMAYSAYHFYLIFKVDDKFTRAVADEHHQKVWQDSCVELFFTPDSEVTIGYFNLEINCIGKIYCQFKNGTTGNKTRVEVSDLNKMDIASTYEEAFTDEVEEENTWSVELKIPFEILKGYTNSVDPASGITWRGNFQKCGDHTSNPHWITWAEIDYPKPNFHLPQFFGKLIFE